MDLAVIIPTKGRTEIFDKTLDAAIKATRHIQCQIIVVNDSEKDVPSLPSVNGVFLYQNEGRGVAAARNLGVHMSQSKLLLFLDNDILITRETIDHTIGLHSQYLNSCFNPNWEYTRETLTKIAGSPFGRFLEKANLTSFKGWYNDDSWRDNSLFKSKSVASFHLSITRENFVRSGGYNDQFQYAGFEDYDFPLRLKKIGVEFYIDTRVTVHHNEVDRLLIDNWLANQETRAVTRRQAVSLGHQEVALAYSPIKAKLLSIALEKETTLLKLLDRIPQRRNFDWFFFKLITLLQAARIFKGYQLHHEK